MSTNFFQWIRDGVRHSVLAGVSDAMHTLGTPSESNDLHPSVHRLLGERDAPSPTNISADPKPASASGRKRLGKSLREINPGG